MRVGAPAVDALLFDVFGTVVDWRGSIVREGQALADSIDWYEFAREWHADGYQDGLARIRRGEVPWTNVATLHRRKLDKLLARSGLADLDEVRVERFNRVWRRLSPWPDAVPGLIRLKTRYLIAPLSNADFGMIVDLARHAGLPWDCVFAAEHLGHYKLGRVAPSVRRARRCGRPTSRPRTDHPSGCKSAGQIPFLSRHFASCQKATQMRYSAAKAGIQRMAAQGPEQTARRAAGPEHSRQRRAPSADTIHSTSGQSLEELDRWVATAEPAADQRVLLSQRAALQLQHVVGNQAVARLVQRAPEVPGLSTTTETKVKALLSGSAADKQSAIDLVVKDMAKHGMIDTSILSGKKVVYDSSVSGEGATSTAWSGGKPGASDLRIGDDAFSSAAWLYSSILHEFKHAQQHHKKEPTADWREQREVEAYAVEIINSGTTGVNKDKAKMEDLWRRLHEEHWLNMTDAAQKKKMLWHYKKAHRIAQKILKPTVLAFDPSI